MAAVGQPPKTGGGPTLAWQGQAETEPSIEKILFEDENAAAEYLKDLISSANLKGAWVALSGRVQRLEEVVYPARRKSATPQQLEKAFVTRKQCRELIEDFCSEHFVRFGERFEALESQATEARVSSSDHEQDLRRLQRLLDAQELQVTQQAARMAEDIRAARHQDAESHTAVVELHRQLEQEVASKWAACDQSCEDLRQRAEEVEVKQATITEEQQRLDGLIQSKGLGEQLEQICKEYLEQYVTWTDMEQERATIHDKAVAATSIPLVKEMKQVEKVLNETLRDLKKEGAQTTEAFRALKDHVAETDTEGAHRLQQLAASLGQCATVEQLIETESQLSQRMQYSQADLTDFKTQSTIKIEEFFERLMDLESMLNDHEHCLEHHGEELLNRSTKYDMITCQQRIDKCALKERLETEIKELQKTLNWQHVKLENLTFQSNFEQGPSTSPRPPEGAGGEPLSEPAEEQEPESPPSTAPTPTEGREGRVALPAVVVPRRRALSMQRPPSRESQFGKSSPPRTARAMYSAYRQSTSAPSDSERTNTVTDLSVDGSSAALGMLSGASFASSEPRGPSASGPRTAPPQAALMKRRSTRMGITPAAPARQPPVHRKSVDISLIGVGQSSGGGRSDGEAPSSSDEKRHSKRSLS